MRYITFTPLKFTNKEVKAGDTFRVKSEDALKSLLDSGIVRPLKEVMAEKYRELTAWLHEFDLGKDKLEETLPDLYQDIQGGIQRLDDAFKEEDLPAFQDAMNDVKFLYTEALYRCGRRIAIKDA